MLRANTLGLCGFQELQKRYGSKFKSPTASSFVDSRYVLGAGALIGGRFRLIKYIQSGTFKHGWKALDIQRPPNARGEFPVVFCSTLKTREDTIGAATIASLAVQVGSRYMVAAVIARLHRSKWLQ